MEKIVVITPESICLTIEKVLSSSENYEYTCLAPEKTSEINEMDCSLSIIDSSCNDVINLISNIKPSIPIMICIKDKSTFIDLKDREYDIIYEPFTEQELKLRISNVLKIKILKEEISHINVSDELTGLYNRKYLLDRLEEEMSRSKRYETPLTLMLMDIDYFKVVNDMYGYHIGDRVLKKVASILKNHIRKEDIVTRYGDEEFIIALPNTPDTSAYILAERIRKDIKSQKFFEDEEEPMSVTISIGISTHPFPHMEPDVNTLIRYAEHALYNAKKQGKNKVILFSQINFDL